MILKTTLTTRDLAPHNSFLPFPSIFMIIISHDDLLSDPGHKNCVVNIIITWILGFFHGFTDAESDADGLMAPNCLRRSQYPRAHLERCRHRRCRRFKDMLLHRLLGHSSFWVRNECYNYICMRKCVYSNTSTFIFHYLRIHPVCHAKGDGLWTSYFHMTSW